MDGNPAPATRSHAPQVDLGGGLIHSACAGGGVTSPAPTRLGPDPTTRAAAPPGSPSPAVHPPHRRGRRPGAGDSCAPGWLPHHPSGKDAVRPALASTNSSSYPVLISGASRAGPPRELRAHPPKHSHFYLYRIWSCTNNGVSRETSVTGPRKTRPGVRRGTDREVRPIMRSPWARRRNQRAPGRSAQVLRGHTWIARGVAASKGITMTSAPE